MSTERGKWDWGLGLFSAVAHSHREGEWGVGGKRVKAFFSKL